LKTEPAKWMRSKRPEERARGRVCATERASARRSWFGFSAWYQNGADSSRAVGREKKNKNHAKMSNTTKMVYSYRILWLSGVLL